MENTQAYSILCQHTGEITASWVACPDMDGGWYILQNNMMYNITTGGVFIYIGKVMVSYSMVTGLYLWLENATIWVSDGVSLKYIGNVPDMENVVDRYQHLSYGLYYRLSNGEVWRVCPDGRLEVCPGFR